VGDVIKLDDKRRQLIQDLDERRALRNRESQHGGKVSAEKVTELQAVKAEIKSIEGVLKEVEQKLDGLLVQLPNLTHESVPIGAGERDNVIHKKWSPDDPQSGEVKNLPFKAKLHAELGKELDLIDEARGAKIAGARFWYLKRELVYLEFAIIHYALDCLRKEGFVPMLPPMVVRERAMYGTGFFPADENEIYRLSNPAEISAKGSEAPEVRSSGVIPSWDQGDQYLIGTAEVPLAAYHSDEVIDVKTPLKYCGFSSCFRREAGAYGKDLKGILRGHQFDKIEMFIYAREGEAWQMHEYLQAVAERFWQSLEIPYQVLLMCSGDIGAPNAKKYDTEGWLPGERQYRELGSCSNDTDFQARRLNIKYVDEETGEKRYVHTLNNTYCALGRTIIAIMENYQTKEGTIKIPKVLKPYLFGIEEIGPR